jgi:hypothetical protein
MSAPAAVERARDLHRVAASMPPSTQSTAEMRTDIGRSSGQRRASRGTPPAGSAAGSRACRRTRPCAVAERRDERRQQVAVRAVQLHHVEAASAAISVARTNSARTRSMSARVMGRGTGLPGSPRERGRAHHRPPALLQRPVHPLPITLRGALPPRMAELQADLRPASRRARSRRCARHAVHVLRRVHPRAAGRDAASGDTHVISVITSPAPPSARAPRCTRWKSLGVPSTALYMSIGETTTRLCSVIPRSGTA